VASSVAYLQIALPPAALLHHHFSNLEKPSHESSEQFIFYRVEMLAPVQPSSFSRVGDWLGMSN
jgi:hypothetical protein